MFDIYGHYKDYHRKSLILLALYYHRHRREFRLYDKDIIAYMALLHTYLPMQLVKYIHTYMEAPA